MAARQVSVLEGVMVELRWVERDCYVKDGEPFSFPFKERTLQWRDGKMLHVATHFDPKTGIETFPLEPEWVGTDWTDVPTVAAA